MNLNISNTKRQHELSKEIRDHVGIENVRNRLNILYNGKHELTFAEENNLYNVHLFLKLDV
jgi:sensor histidine kinase YesM